MKSVVILGQGSREHAIQEKLCHHQVELLSSEEEINMRSRVDLVVVGSEKYLVEGIADTSKFPVFGPSQAAARIEGSKIFSKNFMKDNQIPTSNFFVPESKSSLISFFRKSNPSDNTVNSPCKYVIKRDGLFSGKGVYLPNNIEEFESLVQDLDGKILVEERLMGTEVSVMGFCNGKDITLFPQIQDYKRLSSEHGSPNTGGMGSIGPVNVLTESEVQDVKNHMLKVVTGLNFKGVLYAGLMKTSTGVFFLEFNCRMGDPETQVGLGLLDTDLYQIMTDCIEGNKIDYIKWKDKSCACVVLSHSDYPKKKLEKPIRVSFGDLDRSVSVYLSNPNISLGSIKTYGGRVASVVSVSDSISESLENIYNNIYKIHYPGRYFRTDIGLKYMISQNEKKRKLKIGILSSSRGTSIQKLLQMSDISVELIVCDRETEIIDKAKKYKIPYFCFLFEKSKEEYFHKLSNIFETFDLDFIFCVGFKRIIPNSFCKKFEGRLLNIHPSLLPEYKGLFNESIHKKVLDDKVSHSGCTLHYVTGEVDAGRMALQSQYRLRERETLSSLKTEIQKLESDCIVNFLKIQQSVTIDYKKSGVNIDEGDEFVNEIRDEFIGSFCALYPIGDNYFGASTDGVGTKLELANKYGMLENIGFDLVGMCVNDLIVRGIRPKFFLDYIAMDQIDKSKLSTIVGSIKEACSVAECKLIGGETAEMPGVYRSGCLDLAGFSVGTLDGELYPKMEKIKSGMKIYGIPSNGIHSNGFSLVRKLLKYENYNIETLLRPTKIYMECFEIMESFEDSLLGMAHITGGGLVDNIKRILPEDLELEINIDIEDEFEWLMRRSGLKYDQMIRTFNCGYGIALIFDETYSGDEYDLIGRVI
jgi:phosphoribosylformylglycinamidine cyclo-ligase